MGKTDLLRFVSDQLLSYHPVINYFYRALENVFAVSFLLMKLMPLRVQKQAAILHAQVVNVMPLVQAVHVNKLEGYLSL